MGNKRKNPEEPTEHANDEDNSDQNDSGIGKKFKEFQDKNTGQRLIVVLERANMESIKNGREYQLLNCDDHIGYMKKYNKDPKNCRPDILHQCLLMLQDSPLNQAGKLQVY